MKFRVVWKKNNYDVTFPLDEKVLKLKEHIQTLTGLLTFNLVFGLDIIFVSNCGIHNVGTLRTGHLSNQSGFVLRIGALSLGPRRVCTWV